MAKAKTGEKSATVTRMPTHVGDVLVLRTDESFAIYAVGLVAEDGQQGFGGQLNVNHVRDRAVAMAKARALAGPGHRIFLCDIDSGDWSEIPLLTLVETLLS